MNLFKNASPRFHDWTIISIVTGIVILIFLSLSLAVYDDDLIMPLDDAYIHFQYARQMASGEPYKYNSSDDPTSGATSLFYVPLLAVAYAVGFKGLSLGFFAVGVGVLCHVLSTGLVFRLLTDFASPENRASVLILSLAYAISGAFVWAALSGMETSLFVFTVLLTYYYYNASEYRNALFAASFAAIVRPEGAVIALTVLILYLWNIRKTPNHIVWIVLPGIAVMAQPLLNLVLTGTYVASGTLAKSHLYNLSIPLSERIQASIDQFGSMWWQLIRGHSAVDGWYIFPLLTIPAMIEMIWSLYRSWRERRITAPLLAVIWMLLLTAAISTLDTANWHFKRYQLPVMALMVILGGRFLLVQARQTTIDRRLIRLIAVGILISAAWTTYAFAVMYRNNVHVIVHQQVAMAEWVDASLPQDARIGVHDIGIVNYIGNRATYDVVGLTTPGQSAALAWRQGPGAVYEIMAKHENRPDYFAIYHDVQGLPFLQEAGIFGEVLARFELELPQHTVASASETQIVSRADWSTLDGTDVPHQHYTLQFTGGAGLRGVLNIGELDSEDDFAYSYTQFEPVEGFITDVRTLPYAACEFQPCTITDGGRVITGTEHFLLPPVDIANASGRLIVLRVHAASPVTLIAGCDESNRQIRVVPNLPGQWVEVVFTPSDENEFCVQSEDGSTYFPARYWIYDVNPKSPGSHADAIATFTDPIVTDFTFDLVNFDSEMDDSNLILNLTFQSGGNLQHDGKIFVHLYRDIFAPPAAQRDVYARGSLPPANWLPGLLNDQITIPLDELAPGEYRLAIGFYDPNSARRYAVMSDSLEIDDSRLFLQSIMVE
ncbi:MAG TPA: hypothetical protein VJZ27_11875 [Aggregatilineales bacterium]|nr:hypothetical protein [Aggregatilineales bacterium]